MTIPDPIRKDILEDLAALYLSGDASAGTRQLLESYARDNPEFAARLRDAGRGHAPQPPAPVNADAEARALQQTRQAILLRSIFMAMGIAFSVLPLSFTCGPEGVHMLFFPRQMGLISAFWSIAAASWVAMYVMHRAARRRGL